MEAQPFTLRLRKFFTWVLSDWTLMTSMLVLLYVLNHFGVLSPLYFIFLALIGIESAQRGFASLLVLIMVTLFLGIYMPDAFRIYDVDGANAAQIKLLRILHFKMVKNPFVIMWEQVAIFFAALLFRLHGQMGRAFEAIVLLTIPMLFLLFDSDGMYWLSEHFSDIQVDKSLLTNNLSADKVLDTSVVFIMFANVIWLSLSFWIAIRLSAWIHGAYKVYAQKSAAIRLSYAYPFVCFGIIYFDPQWLLVVAVPIWAAFISLVIYAAEKRKFRRQEAVIIALGIFFMIYSLLPGLTILLFIPLIDSFVDLRKRFDKFPGKRA